jgi:signal transduction histidine kinase
MNWREWFQGDSYIRAIIEALVVGGVLTVILNLGDLLGMDYVNAYVDIIMLAVMVFALRVKLIAGRWLKQLVYEVSILLVGMSLAWVLMLLIKPAVYESLVATQEVRSAWITPLIASPLILVPQLMVMRIIRHMWFTWSKRRHLSLVWELTYGHFLLVMGLSIVIGSIPIITTPVRLSLPWAASLLTGVTGTMMVASWLIIGLTVVLIGPSALVSYFISRPIARRLQRLADATSALSAGDTAVRIDVDGQDEVAHLQADFNAMADALEHSMHDLEQERDKVKALLASRRELFAGVAHDLRTPIATARATLESILTHQQSKFSSDVQVELQHAVENIVQLQHLINDVFTVARSEVGHLDMHLEHVDAVPLLRRIADSAATAAWQKGEVKLVADLPPVLPLMNVDTMRLEQVINNLIQNAVRHTPPGGVVALVSEADEAHVTIFVADTGEGISAEDLAHIWERYYRVGDEQTSSSEGGAGLGLTLVKELVDRMDGSVSVESKVGSGSKFTLVFPIVS